MIVNEIIKDFTIWTSNEEKSLLEKLDSKVKLSSLSEYDQNIAQGLIRKNLIKRIGFEDPTIFKHEPN